MNPPPVTAERIQSIDILRALTMVLMIWVNDFWSLVHVPDWLEHMPATADAMGFSDVIFPAFLFIVGLSIPFAIRQRRSRGASDSRILIHIGERSFALLLMGFFMVNLESYHDTSALLPRALWQTLMIIAFILIWNQYPRDASRSRVWLGLKTTGYCLLVGLALVYRSDPAASYTWMQPHWWGILGLIGWSYLICASVQLYWGNSWLAIAFAWIALAVFNIASFAGWLESLAPVRPYVWIAGNGSLPALTMAGCFVSTLYLQVFHNREKGRFLLVLVAVGISVMAIGFLLRPYWGISKIHATPAWTELCTGIAMLSYAFFYWLVDIKGWSGWARVLKPAGVATLTCYLIPYLAYPLFNLIGIDLPEFLRSGAVGLLKSMAFALFIVFVTGLLNQRGVKLKI